MKVYQQGKIMKDVRIAIDRNTVSTALTQIGDVDTLSLDQIIRSKILEGIRRVHSEAPVHILDGGYNFGEDLYWNGDDVCGWVLLPEDFMRFVVFQMDDWERPVFSAITPEDAEYALQSSRFKGIRGTPQKPVCAVSVRPEGRVLEFWSCKSQDAEVSKAVYLPYPSFDEYGAVEICERCYNAVVYTIASLTLTTVGEGNLSGALTELAKSALI